MSVPVNKTQIKLCPPARSEPSTHRCAHLSHSHIKGTQGIIHLILIRGLISSSILRVLCNPGFWVRPRARPARRTGVSMNKTQNKTQSNPHNKTLSTYQTLSTSLSNSSGRAPIKLYPFSLTSIYHGTSDSRHSPHLDTKDGNQHWL